MPGKGSGEMRVRGRLIRDERGATAIEYGLLAALISVFLVAGFNRLGLNLAGIFQTIASMLVGGGG